jgi:GT2 family glycosyltransferase
MKYIIATNTIKRSAGLVTRSLQASLKQKIKPLKVILIDQNIPKIELPVEIIHDPLFERQTVHEKSVSGARNSLIIPSGAEWIFFCDDDGYPCEDYSEILESLICKHSDLEILAGSIIRDDNNEFYSLRHKKGGSLKFFRNTKNLMGSNFVVKVDVFNHLSRFDELFGAGSYFGSSEETDFCWKAFFKKIKMEFFPELVVYHVPPFNESIKKGFRKSFNYGTGKGALVWKWLFKEKKLIVLYEAAEMMIIPIIQCFRGVIKLAPALIVTNFATITGRVYGLFKAMLSPK